LPAGDFIAAALLWGLTGLGIACVSVMPLSIVTDIIDYDTVTTGSYTPGIYFSTFNLVMKIGMAFGVGVTFGMLEWLGFDPQSITPNSHDSWHIKLVGFALPGLLLVPALFFMKVFPINKAVHRNLRGQLDRQQVSGNSTVEADRNNTESGVDPSSRATVST